MLIDYIYTYYKVNEYKSCEVWIILLELGGLTAVQKVKKHSLIALQVQVLFNVVQLNK
jgi:hypothetical protein